MPFSGDAAFDGDTLSRCEELCGDAVPDTDADDEDEDIEKGEADNGWPVTKSTMIWAMLACSLVFPKVGFEVRMQFRVIVQVALMYARNVWNMQSECR